jgi:3-phosphoshikimate 1-carboxyvinyltransferase
VKRWRVRRSSKLEGAVRVPGDKSIGHRALLFAALAEGESIVHGLSGGLDNRATAEALRAMGAGMELGGGTARVRGVGLHGLRTPGGDVDCGNSGTSLRLLAGLLVAQRFGVRLVGDESLSRRPMRRIVEPLRARGGHIAGRSGDKPGEVYPPLAVAPLVEGEDLIGLEYDMPVASAQVKSALLLSGLYACGPTALKEPVLSRDHTERMMLALGAPIETMGSMVVLDPEGWRGGWDGFEWEVPGDPSGAAFPLAAAYALGGSEVRVEGVCVNPTRTGFLDALRAMGGGVELVPKGDAAGSEPIADLVASHQKLAGGLIAGELLTRMIDEVPALCAIAAFASGRTEIRDAAELRVKESDRIATMAEILASFGVPCVEYDDGMRIDGGTRLHAANVTSHGDHRIAMAAAVIAMGADGESTVDDVECVDTSFPGFAGLMRSLGADIEEQVTP